MPADRKPRRLRIWLRRSLWIVAGVFFLAAITGVYHTNKSLPEGVSFAGPERDAVDVRFLRDLTYVDDEGNRKVEQEIFDAVFEMIRNADRFILVDMFLFNEFQGAKPEKTRELCRQLTDELVERKREQPGIEIHVITDPINTVYGGMKSSHLDRLRESGIHVTLTDLSVLRDSNALYSSFWRLFVRPFGNSEGTLVSNPLGAGRVSLRSCFSLLNFKANHRKSIVADSPGGLVGLVTSANPHDGSSAHENVALQFAGMAALDLLRAEEAVLEFSGGPEIQFDFEEFQRKAAEELVGERTSNPLSLKIVSEKQIKLEALRLISSAEEIDLVMFYLSDREIVTALTRAAERGAKIRVILDPNKDAFGHQKGGIPNRQVAGELVVQKNIEIRWADTNGEQCHSKMLLTRDGESRANLLLGSANYTRRNIDDFNLELDASVSGPHGAAVLVRARDYFDMAWENRDGRTFTADYDFYRDHSKVKRLRYRVMERTGLCTF